MLARKPLYQQERTEFEQTLPRTYHSTYADAAVAQQSAKSVKEKISWIITIGICTSVAIFVVSQYAAITKKSYQIDQLNQQIRLSTAQNASLQAESISLSNPERIMDIALNKLHMQFINSSSSSQIK